MKIDNIINEIDAEIARLQHARGILAKLDGGSITKAAPTTRATRKRKPMSAAAKKRIAAAQKARWAKFHAAKKAKVVKMPAKAA